MADVTLRSYVFLDDLQPQLAAFIGTTARGFLPVAGVASLFVETAPGLVINRLMDVALKATSCTPAIMVVERAFGMLEIHDWDKGQVQTGGQAVLDHLNLEEHDRVKPRVVSDQVIRSVEPYHAQLINKIRYGDQLLPGESLLFVLDHTRADDSVYQRARLFDDVLSHVADFYVDSLDERCHPAEAGPSRRLGHVVLAGQLQQ